MPAHIRGCDAKTARSVDQGGANRDERPLRFIPAEEDAQPQITALTQPYMLTIRIGARSTWKAGWSRQKKIKNEAARRAPAQV